MTNTISYTSLRQNLREVMDTIVSNSETYEITRTGQEPVIMLSKHDYVSMHETLYLLSNKANSERLAESIEQASNGDIINEELIEEQ